MRQIPEDIVELLRNKKLVDGTAILVNRDADGKATDVLAFATGDAAEEMDAQYQLAEQTADDEEG